MILALAGRARRKKRQAVRCPAWDTRKDAISFLAFTERELAMSLFEFLMVLLSLIVGLGIAEVLTGTARTIRWRQGVQLYWVHSVLVVTVFIALVQQWWEIWGLRNTPEWTFPGLLMMLGGPAGLYLIAHLIFPEPMEGADFREFYYGPMRPIWWIAFATVIIASTFRPLVVGTVLLGLDNLVSLIGVIAFAVLALSRNPKVHGVLMPLVLLAILFDVFFFTYVIA